MSKQVVVIAGPSGSGESTITNAVIAKFPQRVTRLVTSTSRPPRTGEANGTDYYFFTKEEFLQKRDAGEILESTYVENRDVYYGTYAPDLTDKIKSGYIIAINPDIVGTKYYKEHYDAATIFIKPESIDQLMGRIRKRSPEFDDAEIARRREQAKEEMNDEQLYDYVVVNADGKLDEAVDKVIEILKKEGYNLG